MRPVLKTNNPVQLNFAEVILKDAGIASFVFDAQMSMTEGSVGVFPRRLMVADADFERAVSSLRDGLPGAPLES
jgi:hypothetical protein